MTTFAQTSDAAVFSIVDFPQLAVPPVTRAPIALVTGNRVYTPENVSGFTLTDNPVAVWGCYEMLPGTELPPGGLPLDYFDVSFSYALQGPLGQDTSTVQQTRAYNEIPIADLYEIKRQEITRQDQTVRYNAADTSLAANWWLVITQDARFELDGIQGNWLQRQIDGQGFPSGPNAPWVGIYNANTAAGRRQQVTDATQWNTLYLEKTQHDQATGNATDASNTALDAAYNDGAGDWQAVADHDAADPAWGYPPTIVLQL